ncbi:MAG: hypothetical protein V8R75_03515 [Oscillospiraceae bacterium]
MAGRKAPLLIVAGSLFATWVSSATVMGYAGSGYTVGLGAFWSGASFIAATMWMGIWIIPRLRKAELPRCQSCLSTTSDRPTGW